MKSLMPWICLITAVHGDVVWADNGLKAYRQGSYFQAAQELTSKTTDPAADYYQGMMRLYGYGELRNPEIALQYFQNAADKDFLPAQLLLGAYYLNQAQAEKAFYWYKKAAEKDITAKLYCAAAYKFGYGVKKNEDAARQYYIDTARTGNSAAQLALARQFLANKQPRDKKMGVIWLKKAVSQNNSQALIALAHLYIEGKLVPQDWAQANDLINRAINNKYAPAVLEMGNLERAQGHYDEAVVWYTKAQSDSNGDAELALAMSYLDKKSSIYNEQTGFSWALKAAEKGSYDAQSLVAILYKDGKGTTKDDKLSQHWQAKAAETLATQQHVNALAAAVSLWLTDGKQVNFASSDYELKGIYTNWSNKNALKNNIYNAPPHTPTLGRKDIFQPEFKMQAPGDISVNDYFNILANSLTDTHSGAWNFPRYPLNKQIAALRRDDSLVLNHNPDDLVILTSTSHPQENVIKPFDYFEENTEGWQRQVNYQAVLSELYGKAILGDPDAQFEIGQLYQYGIGVSKNIEQALIYLQLAAAQQDIRAEYNLGVIYLEGKTEPKDYQKGLEWMTDAAFKGNAYAQYVLANLYDKGLSDVNQTVLIEPDHEQALAMYNLSAVNHYAESLYYLAEKLVKEKDGNLSVAAQDKRNQLIKRLLKEAAVQGQVEAELPLAFYNATDTDPQLRTHAYHVAKVAAENGNKNAAVLLGLMLERGIAVPADSVEALYWFKQAEDNPVSQFILGTYYAQGQGVSKDTAKAEQLLKSASEAGLSYALLNLAVLHEQQGTPFIAELDKAREEGNSKAGLLLADYYLNRADDPNTIQQAQTIYQYFADKGDRDAQLKLGFLHAEGLGVAPNNEAAMHWYSLAANQGQPLAQYLLAQSYQEGLTSEYPDYKSAKKWYSAAKVNYIPAYVALGFIYDTVDSNYELAEQNYLQAAKVSDAMGQYNLGLIYEHGKGVPIDYTKAQEWYQKSAEHDYPPAMTQLGSLYFKGDLGAVDEQQALYWYKKAASLNEPVALYQMGLFYETSVATKLDFPAAINSYQQAANAGDEKAKAALARIYLYGTGVAKNIEQAQMLYQQLADNNNAYAQYQLGVIYINGLAGAKEVEQGKQWLAKARKNGNIEAGQLLQWYDAQQQNKISFIQPVSFDTAPIVAAKSADLMYLDALSEWNRGNETLSRQILKKLVAEYPRFAPGRKAYEQINYRAMSLEANNG